MVHGNRVGSCAQIAQRACADEEEQGDECDHRDDCKRIDAGQPVTDHPGTAPHIDTDDAKDGGVEARDGVVGESPLIGMDVILEEVLCDREEEVTQATDDKGGECREGQAVGEEEHPHQFPCATPIGNYAGRDNEAGEQHVQYLQQ